MGDVKACSHLATNFLLRQQILSLVVENDVHLLRAVATDVWAKHDVVRTITMHVLLVEITGEELDVSTTAVNLLLMLDGELDDEGLALVCEWLIELG